MAYKVEYAVVFNVIKETFKIFEFTTKEESQINLICSTLNKFQDGISLVQMNKMDLVSLSKLIWRRVNTKYTTSRPRLISSVSVLSGFQKWRLQLFEDLAFELRKTDENQVTRESCWEFECNKAKLFLYY